MIRAYLFDFARVILFPKDELYKGELNKLHKELSQTDGYNFLDRFALDPQMLDYLYLLRRKADLYMFTSGSIQNAPEIRPVLEGIFKKIFSASEMGVPKEYPLAYKRIAQDIGMHENEIVFIDDTPRNVDAAREAGLHAIVFRDLASLKEELSQLE